jgi:hypothetical protein
MRCEARNFSVLYTESPIELVRSVVSHLNLNTHGNIVANLLMPLFGEILQCLR